jgi:hypothetical protein
MQIHLGNVFFMLPASILLSTAVAALRSSSAMLFSNTYRLSGILLLAALNLSAQKPMLAEGNLPTGSWTFLAGANADSLISEKALQGKYYMKSILNFSTDNKYEFTMEEYDAAGTKLTQVREMGTYSFTSSQFTLQPKNSETIFNPPVKRGFASAATRTITNALSPALYNWQVEKNKTTTQTSLIMTAIQPGFREGVFSTGAKGYRQLPPARQKSIARSM